MPRAKTAPKTTDEPVEQTTFDFKKSFQKLKPESFWQFLKEYPSWEGGALYLYRLWPVIDRKLGGVDEKNIDVFNGPITEQDILSRHGSGKYLLMFNDSNRPQGLVRVADCKVEINEPMYEPVVRIEEVVEGAEANRSYIEGLKARGKWKENPMPQTDNGAATAEMARTLNNAVEKLAERPAAAAETSRDPFDIGLKFAALLAQSQPKQASDPFEMALTIVERLNPPAKAVKELDPLEVYAKVAEVIDQRVSRVAGGGGGGGGIDWAGLFEGAVKAIPMIMQGFAAMQAMPRPVAPGAMVPSNPYPMAPAQPAAPVAQTADVNAVFEQLKPFLVKALTQGQTGDEFAAGLCLWAGEPLYQQLVGLGMEGLLGQLQAHQEMWMMLSPFEDQVRVFIQDFLDYGKPEEAGGPLPEAA